MIFYNCQLMQSENHLCLYLVSNPVPFERFEDHEAAIQLKIHELVEQAIKEGESPILLIEEYLNRPYFGGDNVDEIAAYIYNSDLMLHAMHELRDAWMEMDLSLPEVSLKHGGTTKAQALQVYQEITLRSYLETLAKILD